MNPIHHPSLLIASGWDGPGPHAGGWFWPIIPLLWIVAVGLIVWFIARRRPSDPDPMHRAREVLAERYGRGELSTDEYIERADTLR